jgi:hypothetical protein
VLTGCRSVPLQVMLYNLNSIATMSIDPIMSEEAIIQFNIALLKNLPVQTLKMRHRIIDKLLQNDIKTVYDLTQVADFDVPLYNVKECTSKHAISKCLDSLSLKPHMLDSDRTQKLQYMFDDQGFLTHCEGLEYLSAESLAKHALFVKRCGEEDPSYVYFHSTVCWHFCKDFVTVDNLHTFVRDEKILPWGKCQQHNAISVTDRAQIYALLRDAGYLDMPFLLEKFRTPHCGVSEFNTLASNHMFNFQLKFRRIDNARKEK